MGASPNDEPFASPRNFFLCRERRVAVLFAELLGRSLLPFSHFAAVDHDIMAIPLSLDLDLAKFDQSRFDLSMFRSLELKARDRPSKNVRSLTTSPSVRRERRWTVAKYVFILLLGAASISCTQALSEAPPWKEEMAKGYFPYHRLAATDFPVNDHLNPEYGMYTRVFFHYSYNHRWSIQNGRVVDRVTNWLVWSGFDRNKSSRKSWFKLGNEALPHEQGHLDINELHSRRLAEMSLDMLPHGEGANPKEASADLSRKVEALATRASKEAKKEHDQYDSETAHGKNLSKQREWSAAIQARLERAGIHF
jgi:hypothetical protein